MICLDRQHEPLVQRKTRALLMNLDLRAGHNYGLLSSRAVRGRLCAWLRKKVNLSWICRKGVKRDTLWC